MKRVLVFLLLFGSALALVLWLERRDEPAPEGPVGGEETAGETAPEEPAPAPAEPPGGAGARPQGGIQPGERFELRGFFPDEDGEGERPVRFHVRAVDSSLAGEDAWDLRGVVAELFEREDGARQLQVRAARGTARVAESDVPYEPRLLALELYEVEADVERGAPILPLAVRAPRVSMPVETQRLVAPDEARFEGVGLVAKGRDALLDLPSSQLAFRGGGEVEVERGAGERARLSSVGPLLLYRQDPGAALLAPLFLTGAGGTRIELEGERPATMTSGEVLLRADETPGGGAFAVRSLEMEGEVRWSAPGMRIAAERATAELDPEGAPVEATFEGLPSIELALVATSQLAAALPQDEQSLVRLAGAGPAVVSTRDGRTELRVGGPTTAATAGADLRAGGDLFGWRELDGRAGLSAAGGVVLEGERSTLETAELEGRFIESAAGTPTDLRIETRGGARLAGTLEDGRSFTLTTPDRLVAERRGPTWHVAEATNVVLTVDEGGEQFEVRAGRVRELDVAAGSFDAEGGVRFAGPGGSGVAEEARVLGGEVARLEGTDQRPARFEGEPGSVEARWLEVRPGALIAGGAVRATVDPDALGLREARRQGEEPVPGRLELSCEDLDVRWSAFEGRVEALTLRADGAVRSHGRHAESEWDVRSEHQLVRRPAVPDGPRQEILFRAEGRARARVDGGERGSLELDGRVVELVSGLDGESLSAEGGVHFRGIGRHRLEGTAESLALRADGRGRLVPADGERLLVRGTFASGLPFELTADAIDMQDGEVVATAPDALLRPSHGGQPTDIRGRGRRMRATQEGLTIEEEAVIEGRSDAGEPWRLEAGQIYFRGELNAAGPGAALQAIDAEGDVHLELFGNTRATGERIEGSPLGEMRLVGSPARVDSPLFRLESSWITFDPRLQIVTATGSGTILPSAAEDGGPAGDWRMHYLASRLKIDPDAMVLALQEPELEYPAENARLRATWSLLWLDRHRWERLPSDLREGEQEQPPREGPSGLEGIARANLFEWIHSSEISRYLNEAYFEGPVELTQGDDLVMRAGALYLDSVAGHGWIVDATVNVIGRLVGIDFDKLIVKADWLRYSSNGSLRADSATVTPCDHADPHVRIVTGDLRITPHAGRKEFELSLRDNRIELYDLLEIPLPPIRLGTDEEYEPLWQTLRLADSARFGTLVSAGIRRPADRVGRAMNKLFRASPVEVDASYELDASWLGSRGILLDAGLEAESEDVYRLDAHVGGLPDRGEDRGFLRIDEDDRDTLRLWYRSEGRWKLSDEDRLDLSLSVQTDAGVQSEFFESEFLRYERDQSYLRWTRAWNGSFLEAAVVPRVEDFRTTVEELPSAGIYGGRRPVAELGGVDVLYTGRADAGYLRRRAGDPGVASPFARTPPLDPSGAFADGLGERDVLRLDTEHRLEAPLSLGGSGVKATPYVATRLTAWDEGADADESPTRWRSEAGVRLATTFWRRNRAGTLDEIVPFVAARGELALEEEGGDPVPLDEVEAPLDGSFVDFGLRGRFGVDGDGALLDLEVVNSWGEGLRDEDEDGWQPTAIFARAEVEPFGHPFELWHDGRHDLVDGETAYSLVGIATRWNEDLRLQASHHRGRDAAGGRFFEAATVRGIYRWTEKWELEGRQTFSLLENDDLNTDFLIRRYGHDVVFELETSFRAGEGTSFSINIKPRFGFRPPRIGYLSY